MAVARSEVAERYATALFELARDEGQLETVERDLDELSRAMNDSEDLRRLVRSPVFDAEDKGRAFGALLEQAGAAPLTRNFIALLARNGRLSHLEATIDAFGRLLADHRGEVTAEAVSARPLSDEQTRDLRAQIEASVGRSVKLDTRVDESLLGGLIVKVGSRMIDSSLRTKLNRLQQSLKEA
jgi:F-type H+-transporting ATPase subunit delta